MTTESDDDLKQVAVEKIKADSRGLAGMLPEELGDAKPAFSEEAVQLLKHHGAYQQDNRDTRTERKKAKLDRDYRVMLRTKFPGGTISAEQYLICDDLAEQYGQKDLRITSRQCFQFHGVVKKDLRPLIHDLNRLAQITSLGACGDVVRNTMAAPVADIDPRYAACGSDLIRIAHTISETFMPTTSSYFDLWVNDEKVTVCEDGTVQYDRPVPVEDKADLLYGQTYLPRKFKIGLATDFDNSVDVFTQDAGVLAVTENGRIVGFDILVGGGLGFTHRKPQTYSRLGTHLAFVQESDLIDVLRAIIEVQRDHGCRTNRKHARMKYLIDDWGMDRFRAEVFRYAGKSYPAPRMTRVTAQPDYLGWSSQIQPGLNYVGVWVENGRIRDFEGSFQFRTGLRKIIEQFRPGVRLTPHHNLILSGIHDADVAAVQALLDAHNIPTYQGISTLRRLEMACPALPLCGLALAEAERFMPQFIRQLEEAGHGDSNVVIRMSGCPNNCSRPRSAEIGIIGSGSDRYQVYVGGNGLGMRLNELLGEKIKGDELGPMLATLMSDWKAERGEGEAFGEWSHRVGAEALRTRVGAQVHD